jgi:hypothetical protein
MIPVLARSECRQRLATIFPPAATQLLAGDLAAAAVTAMLHVGAVIPDDATTAPSNTRLVRPTTLLWMSDEFAARTSDDERLAYYAAARKNGKAVRQLADEWEFAHRPWYADNSRETLRDEVFPELISHGALWLDTTVPTTSGAPRYALTESFAALFDPALDGEAFADAAAQWQHTHLTPTARGRTLVAQQLARTDASVTVSLPAQQGTRQLTPGTSSLIAKGVIEKWAPAKLAEPFLLFLSESATKLHVIDAGLLRQLGLEINASTLLPDLLMFEARSATFWFIEVVATDGPVDEARKAALTAWAANHGIEASSCQFLTAFASRTSSVARRRFSDLAGGTWAWFLDEPDHELAWVQIPNTATD